MDRVVKLTENFLAPHPPGLRRSPYDTTTMAARSTRQRAREKERVREINSNQLKPEFSIPLEENDAGAAPLEAGEPCKSHSNHLSSSTSLNSTNHASGTLASSLSEEFGEGMYI